MELDWRLSFLERSQNQLNNKMKKYKMKINFLSILLFAFLSSISNFVNGQNFEGEVVYSKKTVGGFKVNGNDINVNDEAIKRGEYYNTTRISIKGENYKKTKNKSFKEHVYFDLSNKKSAQLEENKEKIFVDDLSYLNLINRECNTIGTIKNIEISDTIISKFNLSCNQLIVKGELGIEKYIFSDELPKLDFNRNILLTEDCQIYSKEISKLINHSILISYELDIMNISTILSLEEFTEKEIKISEVEIPSFKEKKKDRKFNKFSGRVKRYSLIND